MVKIFLTIFVSSGSFLIGKGYSAMDLIPPLLSINLGGLILLIAVYIYYRKWKEEVWKEIYAYLKTLYNNVGLFVKQYYDSDVSCNGQQSKSLQDKMEEFVPLLSQNEPSMPKSLVKKIEAFFDKLFDYKRKVEGTVSYNRDEQTYARWLAINEEFNENIGSEFKKIKKSLKK